MIHESRKLDGVVVSKEDVYVGRNANSRYETSMMLGMGGIDDPDMEWTRTREHHVSRCGDSSFGVVAMCEMCRRVTILLAMVAHEGCERLYPM